jgi:DNA-binding MarR family transcriptional regulator
LCEGKQVTQRAHRSGTAGLVDQIVAELGPMIARRQRVMAREWCRQAISMIHLHVLLLLDSEGPLSMSRLAESVDVSLPSATGIVTRMEERGLVRRIHGEDDRRLVLVQLTEGGRAALEKADDFRRQHITRALNTLSEPQLTNLLRAVRDLRVAFDRVAQRADPSSQDHVRTPAGTTPIN